MERLVALSESQRREFFLGKEGIGAHIERVEWFPGFGGAYGAWGDKVANADVPALIEGARGWPIAADKVVDPVKMKEDYGFSHRYAYGTPVDHESQIVIETEYAAEVAKEAAKAAGFDIEETDLFLLGCAAPIVPNLTLQVAQRAGMSHRTMLGSFHLACDGGAEALRLFVADPRYRGLNVIVGGHEGLGRFAATVECDAASQLFGNGTGMMGFNRQLTIENIANGFHAVGDPKGTMTLRMLYPRPKDLVEFRGSLLMDGYTVVAGRMPEPVGAGPAEIRDPLGMIRLLVPNGTAQVKKVLEEARMVGVDQIDMAACHHMNKRIMQMYNRQLENTGFQFPWVHGGYANVSSASSMIALLKQQVEPGQVVMMHGLGIGGFFSTVVFRVS